jgi:hypothetical protein
MTHKVLLDTDMHNTQNRNIKPPFPALKKALLLLLARQKKKIITKTIEEK